MDNLTALAARDDLLAVARRWPQLVAQLHGGGGNALTGMPRCAETQLPIDVTVSDVMRQIEDRTRFYARVLLDEVAPAHGCGDEPEGGYDHQATDCPSRVEAVTTSAMPGILRDVAHRFGHFTHRGDDRTALDFCDDAAEMYRLTTGILDDRTPATYLGPCPVDDHDGAHCHGELYLREDRDRGWCPECGTEFTRETQTRFLHQAMSDRLMTASELLSALVVLDVAVPDGTLHSWISRKRLVPRVEEEGLRPLYALEDAHRLAQERAKRRRTVAA